MEQFQNSRRTFLAGLATGLLLPTRLPAASGKTRTGPVVETASGKVRGLTSQGVHIFKGIPYAAAPAGANRFMPPRDREPWSGVRAAFEYSYSCPQRNPSLPDPATMDPQSPGALIRQFAGLSSHPESEDCLVLNVWTRGIKDNGRRPVMVWLHSGGFESGSGSWTGYDGTHLCLRGDVVVVTLNHRLNALGFSHLGEIGGEEFAQSGNAGMLDIVAALHWTRVNIEAFGGDPQRVTVFGQSGGARKTSTLLAMPAAKGLFHRAIIQSGPGLRMLERDVAAKASELLLDELGISKTKLRALQDIPTDALLRAYYKVCRVQRGTFIMPTPSFAPVVDGNVLPQHPFDPTASPLAADVPVMLGSNRTELALWHMGNETLFAMDDARLQAVVGNLAGADCNAIIDAYRTRYPTASAYQLSLYIESDLYYGVPTKMLAARRVAAGQHQTYVYRFDWTTSVRNGHLQSAHALEVPFAFDNTEAVHLFTGRGPDVGRMAERVSEAWLAFARNGDPNTSKLPRWPAYDSTRPTLLLDNDSEVVADPEGATRALLESVLTT